MTGASAQPETAEPSPFTGFWMGGYEGADHVNGRGIELDLTVASGHWARLEEDHRRAAQAGLACVRESIGWRLAERADGAIDLERALRIAHSARRHGLQVLWTLMHYGLPADLSLHDDALVPRFARFAAEVARTLGPLSARPPVYTPVNEIGYLAWAASQPGLHAPPNNIANDGTPAGAESSRVSGYEIKRRLARAALAAMAAVRAVDPRARFLHVEPVVHVVAPRDAPDLAPLAGMIRGWQWQAWDLLAGRVEPEMGGAPQWLDLVGVNHYHSSQWEAGTERRLDWFGRDPRRLPMGALLKETWQRYGRPVVLAETSHVGAGRAAWLHEMASEARRVRREGVPVEGLCLYPLVDRPDWNDTGRWHRSGLWHVTAAPAPAHDAAAPRAAPLPRSGEPETLAALHAWRQVLPEESPGQAPGSVRAAPEPPLMLVFSHLRWGFVRHRTRQLLARLAGAWRIAVVEEPLSQDDGEPWLDCMPQGPWLDVLVPHAPLSNGGFEGARQDVLHALLQAWLAARSQPASVLWLTTPMAWPLAQTLPPACVVYDCADELSAFLGAPLGLPQLEAQLLAGADIVFAATSTLAAPRAAAAGRRLQLLPNAVELPVFARSQPAAPGWDAEEVQALSSRLPSGPRLGYAGVVDERVDLALLAALAAARPAWQFVFVGPVVKIAAEALPSAANLHWLGELPHRLLPGIMAGWRVGLLPFCAGPATAAAMPLKVLEYLAAGLPVVAAPLVELHAWQDAGVAPAASYAAWLHACDAALDETPAQAGRRHRAARRRLAGRSWAAAAAAVQAALAARGAHVAALR